MSAGEGVTVDAPRAGCGCMDSAMDCAEADGAAGSMACCMADVVKGDGGGVTEAELSSHS